MKLRIEKVGGEYFLDAVENNSIKNIAVFKNYDDALRARDALLAKPPCYNRPPRAWGRVEHGVSRETGEPVQVTLRNNWFEDRCATWDGVGIGQPTPEYPSGTPYPMAMGWDCSGCFWFPEDKA